MSFYFIPLVFFVASLYPIATGYFFAQQNSISATGVAAEQIKAWTQFDNFMIYRAAVQRYCELNPSTTGSIADSLLPLPTGFLKTGAWTNTLTISTGYVYSSTAAEGAIIGMQPDAPGLYGLIVGYNRGGGWTTGAGNSVVLPNYIPDNSVVSVIPRG